jgi:hypothetical protein
MSRTRRQLNEKAEMIFHGLVEGLSEGCPYKKVGEDNAVFMPVHVEYLHSPADGWRVYSVAHRYQQNGDLRDDPDMEFLDTPIGVFPINFSQASPPVYTMVMTFGDDGLVDGIDHRGQEDLAEFANLWMKNIKAQQGL